MILIVIGVDIDGVVNDLTLFHVTYGTKYCFDNHISYTIANNHMDSVDIFRWDTYIDQLFWKQYYLYLLDGSEFIRPFVSEVTQRLIDEGHTLIYITARKDQDLPSKERGSMYDITLNYLRENHIHYSKLIFSQHKKEVIISKHIDVMIEDNPLFFQKYSTILKIPLLCYDTLYNTQISGTNVIRVYSWYDILQKINLIGRKIL